MTINDIEQDFRTKVCEQLSLTSEGVDRYRVFTPFLFDDGDHLAVVLKRDNGGWVLSDEGHTYMHLTYSALDEKDLRTGTRQKIITNALTRFQVEDREGELLFHINQNEYGDALYSFVQSLMKITDVTYLSRERVKSTFMEDFQTFFTEQISEDRRAFNWHDPEHDPQGIYSVDLKINGMPRPLLIYALPSDDRIRDATISLLQFEKWSSRAHSIGIFEDQEQANRRVLARFSDICEKQFSSLGANKDRIAGYLKDVMDAA